MHGKRFVANLTIVAAAWAAGCAGVRPPFALHRVHGPGRDGPVLDLGRPAGFDAAWVSCPTVVHDGETFRMWYSSLYDSRMGRGGIGLATSDDGIHWARAASGRPVLEVGPPGALDDGQVMGPEVLFDDGRYRMWYTGMARTWHESGVGYYRIFLAESEDGVHWQRCHGGRPVLDVGPPGSYDEVQAATPAVLRQGEEYRMWYAAWSPDHGHTICVARSADGLQWRRENGGRPIEGLPHAEVFGHGVIRVGGQYLLLYMTLAPGASRPGLYGALSRDGIHWKPMREGQPVLPVGEPGAFDAYHVGHSSGLCANGLLRLWYTGYSRDPDGVRGLRLRIGLAEGPVNR
jgi:predicted GH43/DUF377 family glycosyl hydrolase